MKKIIFFFIYLFICVNVFAQLADDSTINPISGEIDKIRSESSIHNTTGWTKVDSNVYLTSSTDNVGIGTTTPMNKLDVYGGAVIGTTYAGSMIAPTNGLLVDGNVGIGTAITRAKLDVEGTAYIKGNVGIGTTKPSKKLAIADNCVQLKSPDGSLSNCCVDNSDAFTCTGI